MTWLTEYELNLLREKGYEIGKNVLISDKADINCDKLHIGRNSRIDAFTFLSGDISIGRRTHIGTHCTLSGGKGITIGNFVGISSHSYVFTDNADYSNRSLSMPTVPNEFKTIDDGGSITIKDHNIIGAHSTVFPKSLLNPFSKFGCYSLIKGIYKASKLYISDGNKIAKKIKSLPYDYLLNAQSKINIP